MMSIGMHDLKWQLCLSYEFVISDLFFSATTLKFLGSCSCDLWVADFSGNAFS